MDLKTGSNDVQPGYLDLTCPHCGATTIRYWPAYDAPGDVLSCPRCARLYELTDGGACTIAPFDLDAQGAPRLPRERRP
jgi:ribosomal protein S27E